MPQPNSPTRARVGSPPLSSPDSPQSSNRTLTRGSARTYIPEDSPSTSEAYLTASSHIDLTASSASSQREGAGSPLRTRTTGTTTAAHPTGSGFHIWHKPAVDRPRMSTSSSDESIKVNPFAFPHQVYQQPPPAPVFQQITKTRPSQATFRKTFTRILGRLAVPHSISISFRPPEEFEQYVQDVMGNFLHTFDDYTTQEAQEGIALMAGQLEAWQGVLATPAPYLMSYMKGEEGERKEGERHEPLAGLIEKSWMELDGFVLVEGYPREVPRPFY
ncbi:hypothetical protein L202_01927 [Cryptococcus amylolentus CBS 6039]|uniref:Uncharacterized protein n=2 Tax=Cryptococcus amylolentus TaxID=104669 RepID=A0A1E3HZ87_9TREE|nr:hypothetical protein L202_01927 [Cryptococcus amylolentus CBS 6039]ODN81505.1 hypothetical protein L202_01927 [Cryptococcus amylolentus CBS 6039]ODO10262.1 hypothetical protein I350_02491 [Cryptococcus amylolentus CBS 6273]